MHAAGFCLGTNQAHTHVQLALSCQQSLLKVQHRLRFTMQHVCGHTGNLGNECADHTAALGALHVGRITLLILLPVLERSMSLSASQHQKRRWLFVLHQVLLCPNLACITSLVIVSRSVHQRSPLQGSWLKVTLCHGMVRPVCFYNLEFCRHQRA